MDARSEAVTIPLAIDLDGTLIATDLLWEGLFLLLRRNPLYLFLVPLWVVSGGPARLKQEIASRVVLDATTLPYRQAVVERIRQERAKGRRIILATGSPRPFAEAIAVHLGLFDAVHATENGVNLTAARKRKLLIEHYGEAGFDYAGNSRPDLHIFDAARQAIVVAPDRAAGQWARDHNADLIGKPKTGRRTVVKMLRVHQWLKNTLIAVPVILSHEYFNAEMVLQCLVAFVAFSATASAIYIINDFFDLPLDRQHATKRNRPFASGALSIPFGLKSVAVLLAVAVGAASLLDPLFWLVLGGYLIATTAYSLALKRMLLIDVLTLAGLYTVRILAGAAATGTGVSFWLLAFSVFFFLSLALVKRFVELKDTDIEEGKRLAGRGYRREDFEVISQAGLGAGFAAVLVLALYIDSDAVKAMYATPWLIWPLAPLVLYIILRIWVLARRGEMHEDPVVFIMRDWRSQMMAGLGAMMLLIAVWAGPWA
ncbi:MAG: prenyltransferase [Phyllobacteriaceae bacterium]|nr:prenyltransferase [Phyllobacteriaceae bacterium]MBA90554.1 prenyltransferase [Phyllobacteriaceae bacterium]